VNTLHDKLRETIVEHEKNQSGTQLIVIMCRCHRYLVEL
jgi:hypothetical protein